MPRLIAIENSEAQRRQLSETLSTLAKKGCPLSGRYEAQAFNTWPALLENAITPGLFAQKEAIVIENSETLGEFPKDLASFIEGEQADTVIILVFNTDAKNLAPVRNLIVTIKPEPQVPTWKRQDWLIDLAKASKSKISKEAAQLLADSIDSQEELRSELLKLASYAEGREITVSDVENLSFDEGARSQLIFLDGVCSNRPGDVASSLLHLKKGLMLPLLTAITNRLRPAMICSCFPAKYHDEMLRASGYDPSKKNYAFTRSMNALKIYGTDRIKRFMLGALRLSYLEKTNKAEGWAGFELILWELMCKV